MMENPNFALIDLYSYIEYFEYGGIFAISLLAGIVTVIPIPVAPLLALAALNEQMNPHLLVLSAVGGSVAAKALIFWCSYYGRNILSIKTRTRMLPLHKFINKFGWIAVIVTSATPIPDAPVNIHLGLAKYDFWKFIIAAFVGKLIAYELVVFAVIFMGRSFLNDSISKINDAQLLTVGLAITISYAVILHLTFRLDWTRVLGKRWSDPEKDV
ncbi:MAG: VTT domain-containing protein [Nitrososphaeraceae archaeon]